MGWGRGTSSAASKRRIAITLLGRERPRQREDPDAFPLGRFVFWIIVIVAISMIGFRMYDSFQDRGASPQKQLIIQV